MNSVDHILDILLSKDKQVFRNLSYEQIRQHEIANKEGIICSNEAYCCDTGIFTGRSPLDKYFVQQNPLLLSNFRFLIGNEIPHKLWIEQPENIPTCLAVAPRLKSCVHKFFKTLKLM